MEMPVSLICPASVSFAEPEVQGYGSKKFCGRQLLYKNKGRYQVFEYLKSSNYIICTIAGKNIRLQVKIFSFSIFNIIAQITKLRAEGIYNSQVKDIFLFINISGDKVQCISVSPFQGFDFFMQVIFKNSFSS